MNSSTVRAATLIAALMLTGCLTNEGATPTAKVLPEHAPGYVGPSDAAITAAKAAVTQSLKDPYSAQFSDIRRGTTSVGAGYVCGKVNAKNGFGGYTGAKHFLYLVSAEKTKLMLEEEQYMDEIVREACSKGPEGYGRR